MSSFTSTYVSEIRNHLADSFRLRCKIDFQLQTEDLRSLAGIPPDTVRKPSRSVYNSGCSTKLAGVQKISSQTVNSTVRVESLKVLCAHRIDFRAHHQKSVLNGYNSRFGKQSSEILVVSPLSVGF